MDWINKLFQQKNKRIYLDHAAATPLLPEVAREMEKYWSREFYNPNATYTEGEKVRKEVEEYRTRIARILGVAKESVIFTSGGTEANVLVVRGVKPGRVVAETDSHPSILEAVQENNSEEVVLVSSVAPNNKRGREIRAERKANDSEYPLLHIDASQTAAYFDVSLEKLACDLLTLDSAKLGGPKGCGALVVRRRVSVQLPPRGTPAVPLIAGFCVALEVAARDREVENKRLSLLSEGFKVAVESVLPDVQISLTPPHIINVSVPACAGRPGILPELLVLALDKAGVMVSAGPACNSNKPEPVDTPVRFSLGKSTTEKEVREAAKILCETVQNLLKFVR